MQIQIVDWEKEVHACVAEHSNLASLSSMLTAPMEVLTLIFSYIIDSELLLLTSTSVMLCEQGLLLEYVCCFDYLQSMMTLCST